MPVAADFSEGSTRLTALVTRPSDDAAGLASALQARGIAVVLEPLLDIAYHDDAHPDLSGVQALLFTSANGVRAFARVSGERGLPVLAVGEATAASARDAGFGAVANANGDVADLARLAASRLRPEAGRLLHVAGSAVAGDLGAALKAIGFAVERAVLYDARPATALSDATVAALTAETIDLALFYSPRTAAIFARLIGDDGLGEPLRRVTAIAISAAVAATLAPLPFRECVVATRPNQPSLLAAIDACVAERCGV